MTGTSSFGTSKREGHNASGFYKRLLGGRAPLAASDQINVSNPAMLDRFYSHSSEYMPELTSNSVGLIFTSPPYHVGKDYDTDASWDEYLQLLARVSRECHRVLEPGARLVVNVANLGRRPYIRLNDAVCAIEAQIGFAHTAEIIWVKADGAGGNCAWGSFQSAKAPVIRDLHEYLLVFAKGQYGRARKGTSTMSRAEFMASTLSTWRIPPESAKRIGHPAPFPLALAERVVQLYSYADDLVVDPFCGAGTTCVAAAKGGRRWVGYDTDAAYLDLARRRIDRLQEEPP